MLGYFNQLLDISVLDYDDVVDTVSEADGQIKMDGYLWSVGFVDHSVIAHCAHKRNIVPMAKHTIADPVFWLVTFFVKVIRLSSHRCIVVYIKQEVKTKPTEMGFVIHRYLVIVDSALLVTGVTSFLSFFSCFTGTVVAQVQGFGKHGAGVSLATV